MEADYIAKFIIEDKQPEKVVFRLENEEPFKVKFEVPKEERLKVTIGHKGVLSAGRPFTN